MIINSLLDTDLYKFTMQQAVLHQFPETQAEFQFKCRNTEIDLRPLYDTVVEEVHALCRLRFKKEELDYLREIRFLKSDYIDFLRIFELNPEFIEIKKDPEFSIRIKGPWLHTILFEVPLLAIVNEAYFNLFNYDKDKVFADGKKLLNEKIDLIKKNKTANSEFKFMDFGTRRRFSREWHEEIIQILKKELPVNFLGTSNVLFAMKYHLTPRGTMAHEWLQAGQALEVRLIDSQKYMLENWVKEYRGDLGIALSDVVGTAAFLRDFDLFLSKLYDGVRHDSGDPVEWCGKIIDHYKKFNINPLTKTAVFSDGLDFPKAIALYNKFDKQINTFFGIGTNLTNDTGYKPLQIVIKMTRCNGQPVAKISDSPGKGMCEDQGFLDYLMKVYQISK